MIQRLTLVAQFILVFLFILFEEIIWEGLAEPIYQKIQSLQILQKLQLLINKSNRYIVLSIFISLLLSVEGAGLIAGLFFVQGKIILGGLLYMVKIPIAGFTFWLFSVSKAKLLSFDWFAWAYDKLMSVIDLLKSTDIYKSSISIMINLKDKIKSIKQKYFSKESSFIVEFKSFYKYIKNFKNRKNS
ncbi:MAG TPA: hypothetical protein ENK88_05445 [Campylobacterales bacterium]|nr:hypothetical protein [Campylobacterales bacterium]